MACKVVRIFLIWSLLCTVALSWAGSLWIKYTIIVNLDRNLWKYINHEVQKNKPCFMANAYGMNLILITFTTIPGLKNRILATNDRTQSTSNDHIITDESQSLPERNTGLFLYIMFPKTICTGSQNSILTMSFDDLMKRNNLSSHTIKVGQQLMIGWFDPSKKKMALPDYKPEIVNPKEQNNLEQNGRRLIRIPSS